MLLLVVKGGNIKNRLKLAKTLMFGAIKTLFSSQITVMIYAKNEDEQSELSRWAKIVTCRL